MPFLAHRIRVQPSGAKRHSSKHFCQSGSSLTTYLYAKPTQAARRIGQLQARKKMRG